MTNANIKKLIKIFKMSQKELKKYVQKELKKAGYEVQSDDGYVYAQGSFPVLLVAHMDTVHKELPTGFYTDEKRDIISSPQGIGGDDRNGIYEILEIIQTHNCSVLFTEDEEIGGVGANKFIKTPLATSLIGKFNYIIEIDRKGNRDAVFYECDNPEFTKFITKEYWKKDYGSYSDICDVAPVLNAAAVNLSSGYYNAHTVSEYISLSDIDTIIKEVKKLLDRTTEDDKFEYIEADYRYGKYNYGFYDMYDGSFQATFEIFYSNNDGFDYEYLDAISEEEAVGLFLIGHPDMTYNDIVSVEIV